MAIWVGSREEKPWKTSSAVQVCLQPLVLLPAGAATGLLLQYCCGWCWCEVTWSVPQHRMTARLRDLLHDGLTGGRKRRSRVASPCGACPGQGRQEERGQVELVGHWLLATHKPDASLPPPHSGSSEFDSVPTPQLTTAGSP